MGSAATSEYCCCGTGHESQKIFENALKENMESVGFGTSSNNGILKNKQVSFTPNINLEMPRTAEGKYEGQFRNMNQKITPMSKREKLLGWNMNQRREQKLAAFMESNK